MIGRKKNWDPERIPDRLQLNAMQQRRPLSCTFELTYHCNFHCRMCYIRMTDDQAAAYGRLHSVEEWLDMARQLYDAGVLYLTLSGGECTIYPGFVQLYEQLARMGFRLTIMSNAAAYTDAVRNIFKKYPPDGVGITLYGGSSETYKVVTGDPDGLDKAIENIRFFQSIKVPVSLNFSMIKLNVQDYPKINRLCKELGIAYTLITDITQHHYNPSFSDAISCRLSPAERACIACHSPEEVEIALRNAVRLEKELVEFRPTSTAFSSEASDIQPIQYDDCFGSYTGSAIYWNGEMQTCISMRGYHCVKPFEVGFETAWDQLKKEQDETFRRPLECQACEMAEDCLHNCAGRRYEGTGFPDKPDPYTCEYTFLFRRYQEMKKDGKV